MGSPDGRMNTAAPADSTVVRFHTPAAGPHLRKGPRKQSPAKKARFRTDSSGGDVPRWRATSAQNGSRYLVGSRGRASIRALILAVSPGDRPRMGDSIRCVSRLDVSGSPSLRTSVSLMVPNGSLSGECRSAAARDA